MGKLQKSTFATVEMSNGKVGRQRHVWMKAGTAATLAVTVCFLVILSAVR